MNSSIINPLANRIYSIQSENCRAIKAKAVVKRNSLNKNIFSLEMKVHLKALATYL